MERQAGAAGVYILRNGTTHGGELPRGPADYIRTEWLFTVSCSVWRQQWTAL